MILTIDGNEATVNNDICVQYETMDENERDIRLHVKLTSEGLILDVTDDAGTRILSTACFLVDDLVAMTE